MRQLRRRGFTFIELMLVIGVIAVLAAILFPVFARAREQARTQSCRTNLLNIGLALRIYAQEHDGLYPPNEYDMSPLYPKYVARELIFQCPSGAYDSEHSLRMVPPGWQPPKLPKSPPAEPLGPPGELGIDPGMEPGMEPEDDGTLKTGFIYRGGRSHNQAPLAALVADSEVRHNDRANVLMSDGAIISIPEGHWRALGFGEELPDYLFHRPQGGYPLDEGMPPMDEPPPVQVPEQAPPPPPRPSGMGPAPGQEPPPVVPGPNSDD